MKRVNKIMRTELPGVGLGLTLTAGGGRGVKGQSRARPDPTPSIPGAKFARRQHGRAYLKLIERPTPPTGIFSPGAPYTSDPF